MSKHESITFEYKLDALLEGDGAGTYVQYRDGRWTRSYGPNANPRTRCYDGFGKTEAERKGETTHVEVNERDLYEAMTVARREYENSYARLRNLEKLIQHIPLVKDRRRRGVHEPHLDGFIAADNQDEVDKKPEVRRLYSTAELFDIVNGYGPPDEVSLVDIVQALSDDGFVNLEDEDDYCAAFSAAQEYLAQC